jgi:hypothetical protein
LLFLLAEQLFPSNLFELLALHFLQRRLSLLLLFLFALPGRPLSLLNLPA